MASIELQDESDRLQHFLTTIDQISEKINSLNIHQNDSLKYILMNIVESVYEITGCNLVVLNIGDLIGTNPGQNMITKGKEIYFINQEIINNIQNLPSIKIIIEKSAAEKKPLSSSQQNANILEKYLTNSGIKEFVCFPLIVNNIVEGFINVFLDEFKKLSDQEMLFFNICSNQAAIAIYQARIVQTQNEELLQKEDELDRLNRAGLLISSRLKLEQTLESILELALEMTNAHYGIFRLVDQSNQNLITRAFVGNDMTRPKLEILPINSQSVMAQVARTQQPILIENLQTKEWIDNYYPLDAGLQMKSELAVPLINASGRLEGVLNIESPVINAFTENDKHMLQALATYAVTSIQEVRLLDALKDIAKRIFSQPYGDVMKHLTKIACELLNASSSMIWLVNDDKLEEEAHYGPGTFEKKLPIKSSLPGVSIIKNEIIVSEDILSEPIFHQINIHSSFEWSKALMVPLQVNDGEPAIGVFGVFSTKYDPGKFAKSDWDKKVLTFLSYYAVMLIQNENQQRELRTTQEQRSIAETFAAVGDIASNLLHQLNNKIGTIPVRVQNIQEKSLSGVFNDNYLRKNLVEIERCATEAMQTVKDNLIHLRPIIIEPINLESTIQIAVQNSNIPSEISVNIIGVKNLPEVKAGGQSLLLVFSNLIENAVDAMQGHGAIIITGSHKQNYVEIIVADSGPGINPEFHEKIFELNYSSRVSSRPGKLGFGLWWVKTLITRLGGSIFVNSDGIKGTHFHLILPVMEKVK